MTIDTRTPAEIAYDRTRLSPLVRQPEPAACIPSIEEQIARIGPGRRRDAITILDVDLPSGENIERHTADGCPNDFITVTRGQAELVVEGNGHENTVYFLERNISGVTLADVDDLRALLALDQSYLRTIAALGPEVDQAIAVWESLPREEWTHLAETVGFGAWFRDPHRRRIPYEDDDAPIAPAAEAPAAPAYTPDPNDINVKASSAAAVLVYLLRALDTARADQLIALLTTLEQAPAAYRDQMVDAILTAATPSPPAAPAIEIEYLYNDPNENGDLTEQPCGPLAYITYQLGRGFARVEYVTRVDGQCVPYVTMFRGDDHDELDPDVAEQAARNLLTLLADPRVMAARRAKRAA